MTRKYDAPLVSLVQMSARYLERLFFRFHRKYTPEPMSGCWLWTAGVNQTGYGQIGVVVDGVYGPRAAHRVAWLLDGRVVPRGFVLDHRCRVRSCVNVAHLEVVTQAENIKRGLLCDLRPAVSP
jgi:hypothetical protein